MNSYKRLVPGYEAPVYVAWSGRNRSPLIRVPESRGFIDSFRVTFCRSFSESVFNNGCLITSEVWMVFVMNLHHRQTVDRNIYVMNEEERQHAQIEDLPSTLHNAIKELRKDQVMIDALGRHIFCQFCRSRNEWNGQPSVKPFLNGKENNIWSCTKKPLLLIILMFRKRKISQKRLSSSFVL